VCLWRARNEKEEIVFMHEIKKVPISKLSLLERNPRKISGDQMQKLVESLQSDPDFFNNRPCLVNEKDGKLIVYAGNQRIRAAKKLKWKEVPCIVEQNLDDELMKDRIVKDNKTYGEFDYDILANEFDLDKLIAAGFTHEELQLDIEDLGSQDEPDDSEVLEPPKDPKSKLGDLYELGSHRLLCDNSTDPIAYQKLIANSDIHMVYTDPPYGIDEETDRDFASPTRLCKGNTFSKIIGDDSTVTAIKAYELCHQKNIPIMIFWGGNYYAHSLPETGNWIVWDKRVEEKQRDMNSDCELAWVKSKTNSVRIFRHLWKGMIKDSEQGEARVHPTQKPIALAEWCLKEYGSDCKNILDLFGGSGSTLMACEKRGKSCYMMELDPAYCDIIVQRWMKLTGKKPKLNGEEISEL
jgi:DNA modification methylase